MAFFWQMKDLSKTSFLRKYCFARLNRGNENWGWNQRFFQNEEPEIRIVL